MAFKVALDTRLLGISQNMEIEIKIYISQDDDSGRFLLCIFKANVIEWIHYGRLEICA